MFICNEFDIYRLLKNINLRVWKMWLCVIQLDDSTSLWLVQAEQMRPWDGDQMSQGQSLSSYINKSQ